jgi:homoserine kinase
MNKPVHLTLPATSANLGPAFDTAGLALNLNLEIKATPAQTFTLTATGRNAEICASLNQNLLLETYLQILQANEIRNPQPLAIEMQNEIPLGMGCGSSAAVRLAGAALANRYGDLNWSSDRILTEASLLEGHPDNTAACWLGGFTVATLENNAVHAATIQPPSDWRILLALPQVPLATTKARAMLPATYTREDAVANIQRASLLTAAFALGRGDLLRTAMQDRLHQPYRTEACPLLPVLLPLAGSNGILGAALSGAGPAVLLIVESVAALPHAREAVLQVSRNCPGPASSDIELVDCEIQRTGARYS